MKTASTIDKGVHLRNILVATDFSVVSTRALAYAGSIARRFNSTLCIAHVVSPEDYPSGFESLDKAAQAGCREAQPKINALMNSVACRDVSCETEIASGDIWMCLTDVMRRHASDLLVMGTVGRRGVKKLLLGSVAEEAVRESIVPLLSVGPATQVREPISLDQIVYATDFSDDSLAGLPHAFAWAEEYKSHLTFVHAIERLPDSPYLQARMATVHLRELVPPQCHLVHNPEFVVEMGSPASVILGTAAKLSAELIVIGTRGAGSLARLASHFGSVAHSVVCRAACPVLTVRRSASHRRQV